MKKFKVYYKIKNTRITSWIKMREAEIREDL